MPRLRTPSLLLRLGVLAGAWLLAASAVAAPVCRPGTPAQKLQTEGAIWGISPCGAGAESIQLRGAQFEMPEARPPSGALPGWAAEKWAAGPLQLVGTWDAKWDPFRDAIVAPKLGKIEVTLSLPGAATATRTYDDLAAMAEAHPRWAQLQRDETSVTLVWPDPATVRSPIYLQKRIAVDAAQPTLLQTEVTIWWLSDEPLEVQLQHVVSTFHDPGTGGGGLLSSLSGPPDVPGVGWHAGGETVHHDAKALEDARTDTDADPADFNHTGLPAWIAADSRYFLLALLPGEGFGKAPTTRLYAIGNGVLQAALRTDVVRLGGGRCVPGFLAPNGAANACGDDPATWGGAGHRATMRYFAGPKEIDLLRAVGSDLDQSIDFGWFGMIARPLLFVLKVAHGFTGSWPIAILILTILVKALLWPIMGKSMTSMRKMGALKPELDKIKADLTEEAKKRGETTPDPAELNRRTFALYQQHGVNPLGGCLPMFLQMPVYIALYRTIYSSVELFNQPLFGWIRDLTRHDPFYVLPIVLAALMFAQQRFTPMTTTDDAQRKMMMYIMPGIFGLMMMSLPSGLTLYILTNTVLSMAQTFWLQRKEAK